MAKMDFNAGSEEKIDNKKAKELAYKSGLPSQNIRSTLEAYIDFVKSQENEILAIINLPEETRESF